MRSLIQKRTGGQSVYLPGDSELFSEYWGGRDKGGEEIIPAMLLTNGASVNIRDREGNTPLHYAAEAVRGYTLNLLLKHHAVRMAKNDKGETPLDLAYQQAGGSEIVHLLQPPNVYGEIGDAVRRNDLKIVKEFLKDDPRNVDSSWLWAFTPLQWACNEGNLEMVKLLLRHGADVNPSHRDWDNTLRTIELNRIENYLLAQVTNCSEDDPEWTSRMRVLNVRNKSAPMTDDFNEGIPPRLSPYYSASPLQLAIANKHPEIAKLLIKHDAKIDLASAASLGMTGVIKHAIRVEPKSLNEYSIRAAWDFQPVHDYGYQWSAEKCVQSGTLLHFAVFGNQPETVEYLLKAGADASMLDDEGRTPCQLARELKLSNIVELFLKL